MNHTSPKEKARQGIRLMKEAILDILLEGMDANERIGPQKITERTGLPSGDRDGQHQDWVAFGFLQSLIDENRVWKPARGRYELTDQEIAKRRPDRKTPNF